MTRFQDDWLLPHFPDLIKKLDRLNQRAASPFPLTVRPLPMDQSRKSYARPGYVFLNVVGLPVFLSGFKLTNLKLEKKDLLKDPYVPQTPKRDGVTASCMIGRWHFSLYSLLCVYYLTPKRSLSLEDDAIYCFLLHLRFSVTLTISFLNFNSLMVRENKPDQDL